ncbi:MAG: hypothetical protein K2Y27_27425 [Xanthobacteraceae bacterium]|nr:hypothetical protein [Xanthobacteraceae bacterium]
MADTSGTRNAHGRAGTGLGARSDSHALRNLAVSVGVLWSAAFVVAGLHYDLQMYGDGSLFSYAVAAQDAWAFHWHNIPGRLFVYLYAYLPSEAYVGWFGDARGGVVLYGLLFFIAPLAGLIATCAADRSEGRVIFVYACASTAILSPLVFGFPTEVWVSHALFWPALALCHHARASVGGVMLVFATLLALLLTHAGTVLFAIAILMTVALRGTRDPAFLRTVGIFFLAMAVWSTVRESFPPDDHMARILRYAALHVFDIGILGGKLVLLLMAALAGYAIAFFLFHGISGDNVPVEKVHVYAASVVVAGLAAYWLWFDQALHADNRYYLRTALIVATPGFGMLAALQMLAAEKRLDLPVPLLPRLVPLMARGVTIRLAAGAFAVVTLIHVVETGKFVSGWTQYTAVVRKLATGTASDPALGDTDLVSSQRIGAELNRLSWFSTTPYLSVLVAPNLKPQRLVVDPDSAFFWLSCRTATANMRAERALPVESRRLVRAEACLHRR